MTSVALDFETANEQPTSACAVGLAWIAHGRVVHREEHRIRPPDLRFSAMNIAIHRITPDAVRAAASFPAVWEQTVMATAIDTVLAHNAAFDIGVLLASLDFYGLPWPDLRYLCTVKIARAAWPDLTNHRLPTVAGHLAIELRHHEAGSDAHACAMIALAAMQLTGTDTWSDLAAALRIEVGILRPDGHDPCRVIPKPRRRPLRMA